MPIGGTPILWNENAPADTDAAGAGAAEIRSDKTSIRNAMGAEHFWQSGGGPNTGYHLLGSARAFYDVESNVSSSGTDGRLMVTSDTSRLFHVGSAGTMLLGGNQSLLLNSPVPGGQNFAWAQNVTATGYQTVGQNIVFPNSGYSGLPFVMASAWSSIVTVPLFATIRNITPTFVTILVFDANGNQPDGVGLFSTCTVTVFSVGTIVL